MAKSAFTLIELVIVLTILAILAAIAIPVFQNLHTQARNASTKGALAGIREAITQYRLNEAAGGRSATWPSLGQVADSHCSTYDPSRPHVMENADLPPNAWAFVADHVTNGQEDCVRFVGGLTSYQTVKTAAGFEMGWLYKSNTGQFWANTAENDSTSSVDGENCAPGSVNEANQTENCY